VDLRSVVFAPVGPDSLADQVARRLEDAIRIGLLKEGDRLPPETQLSAWLGISPMTLREALASLRGDGYLETRRGRSGGTFVAQSAPAPPSPDSEARPVRPDDLGGGGVADLIEYRRALVSESAALAAEYASGTDLEPLERLVGEIADVTSWVDYMRLDAEIHIGISALSKSKRIWGEQTSTEMAISGLAFAGAEDRALGARELRRLVKDHTALLEAIREGDSSEARSIAAAHADREEAFISQALAEDSRAGVA
jgi:DNA-binding FadR family transcriptional regulator